MTSRIDGSGGSLMVLGPEEMMAQMMIESNRDNEVAEREAMRGDREAASAAGELRLGQMEEAANFRLASGIVSGSVKVGSSITGGVAAISGATSSGSASGPDAAAAPTGGDAATGESAPLADDVSPGPTTDTPDTTASDRATAIGGSVDGVSGAVTGLIDRLASEADMRATRAETAADEASSASDERRADAEAARRAIDKNIEVLGAISQDRRRAEEAATRA